MKKSLTTLALIACVALFATSCGGNTTKQDTSKQESSTNTEAENNDVLTVASPEMNGDFISGFSNSSYDTWARKLMGMYDGYSTYVFDRYGASVLHSIANAKEPEIYTDENGNKVYKFFLNKDLKWSDGTPITAKDYVFSWLFGNSPFFRKAGATQVAMSEEILGMKDYFEGKTNKLEGVKYIDDTTFEVVVAKEYVPYFYETALVSSGPTPMHRFSPNLTIGEDGSSLVVKDGYEVSDKDKENYVKLLESKKLDLEENLKELDKEAVDQKEALEKEIKEIESSLKEKDKLNQVDLLLYSNALDVASTYRFKPDVVCGAYKFVSFENQTLTLEKNPEFLGNYEGAIPTVKNVIIKAVNTKLDVDLVISGDVDLSAGVVEGEKIEKAKASDSTDMISYKRAGYGKITFLNDLGATKYKEVRQAIGYLLDRDMFVQNVLGGYGTIVDGAYGLSQWMYKEKGAELEEKAIHYALNIEQANKILDESPYVYEKDGKTKWDINKAKEAYDKDKENFDYYRYDKDGNKLEVNHCGSTNNAVSDTIQSQLPDNAKKAGMLYSFTASDFATLLNNLKKPDLKNPKFTAFNLATSYNPVYNPYYTFHSSQVGVLNDMRVADKEVDKIVEKMKRLAPEQKEEFAEEWLKLQLWFNENLPEIPLYSNEYYDIYNKRISGLDTTPFWDWAQDIANIKIVK